MIDWSHGPALRFQHGSLEWGHCPLRANCRTCGQVRQAVINLSASLVYAHRHDRRAVPWSTNVARVLFLLNRTWEPELGRESKKMDRKHISGLSFGLLIAGLVLLTSGFATMIAASANSASADVGVGFLQVLVGLSSWMGGTRVSRMANLAELGGLQRAELARPQLHRESIDRRAHGWGWNRQSEKAASLGDVIRLKDLPQALDTLPEAERLAA